MPFKKGNKLGKGRPPKVDEEHANNIFRKALKTFYKKDDEEQALIDFAVHLLKCERGKLFIANHLFGKPMDKIKLEDMNDSRQPVINISPIEWVK
jgi:hypothetical protein